MRALIQRITEGSVKVGGIVVAENNSSGLMVFLGIGHNDTQKNADYLVKKIINLRIFEDEQGKMNLSVKDTNGEIILVSQFTLYADTRKGNRPSFTDAASPEIAKSLVDYFCEKINEQGIKAQQGIFGADMLVSLQNNGPVTIWMDTEI